MIWQVLAHYDFGRQATFINRGAHKIYLSPKYMIFGGGCFIYGGAQEFPVSQNQFTKARNYPSLKID